MAESVCDRAEERNPPNSRSRRQGRGRSPATSLPPSAPADPGLGPPLRPTFTARPSSATSRNGTSTRSSIFSVFAGTFSNSVGGWREQAAAEMSNTERTEDTGDAPSSPLVGRSKPSSTLSQSLGESRGTSQSQTGEGLEASVQSQASQDTQGQAADVSSRNQPGDSSIDKPKP